MRGMKGREGGKKERRRNSLSLREEKIWRMEGRRMLREGKRKEKKLYKKGSKNKRWKDRSEGKKQKNEVRENHGDISDSLEVKKEGGVT